MEPLMLSPAGRELDPLARRLAVSLDPPSLQDTASDQERLTRSLTPWLVSHTPRYTLPALRSLGRAVRTGGWQAAVTVADLDRTPWVMAVQPGQSAGRCLGLAVDVGTTTVAAELVDLANGATLAADQAYNGQKVFGADITSRLMQAEKPGGVQALHDALLATLDGLVTALATAAGAEPVGHPRRGLRRQHSDDPHAAGPGPQRHSPGALRAGDDGISHRVGP
jgi:uncharacterized 2Fe-2S/4Fe-4S cluster protein (DUF4445 family)